MSNNKEFVVKAAGADRLFYKHLLGKFPDKVPDLKSSKDGWKMQRAGDDNALTEWSLEQSKGTEKYRGKPDGGLSGSGASNYFILIKQKGSDDFLAIPASELCTFKKLYQRAEISLEQAEAQIASQRIRAETANPRLAQAVAAAEGEAALAIPKDEDEADSDEEWKDIKAKAASIVRQPTTTNPGPNGGNGTGTGSINGGVGGGLSLNAHQRRATNNKNAMLDEEDDAQRGDMFGGGGAADTDFVPKPRGAEDWEHEDVAADDDLDMGQDDSDVEGAGMSPRGRRSPSVSDDDDDVNPEQAHRQLKRMLKQKGLDNGGNGEGGALGRDVSPAVSSSISEDESDSGSDVEDLDAMALEVLDDGGALGLDAGGEGGGGGRTDGEGKKRKKSPTPPQTVSGAGGAAQQRQPTPPSATTAATAAAGAAAAGPQAKRMKTEPATTPTAAIPPVVAAAAATSTGVVAESEVRELLRSRGGLPLSDIVAHFKLRVLQSPTAKTEFIAMVKRLARMEPQPRGDGKKYLVLR